RRTGRSFLPFKVISIILNNFSGRFAENQLDDGPGHLITIKSVESQDIAGRKYVSGNWLVGECFPEPDFYYIFMHADILNRDVVRIIKYSPPHILYTRPFP